VQRWVMYWDSVGERLGEERWWWGYLSSCFCERRLATVFGDWMKETGEREEGRGKREEKEKQNILSLSSLAEKNG
jgi:hypothetical protein